MKDVATPSSTLNFFNTAFQALQDTGDGDVYEYRLLLSGCAHNGDLLGDYTKATLGGLLLEKPFALWKVGQCYDEYPQELALWIRVPPITTDIKNHRLIASPHEAIAKDIAALLTLFLRRLVVVVGTTSQTLPACYAKPPVISPWPQPLVLKGREAYFWPRLPLIVIHGEGQPTFKNPNVEEITVSPSTLQESFHSLARHKHGERIINGVRLYYRAMECLFRQTELSYLLLVCAAEAVATGEVEHRSEMELLGLAAAKRVKKCADELGLSEENSRKLALEAVADAHLKEKSKGEMFRNFLLKYGAGHQEAPPLFNADILNIFQVPDETAAINQSYRARSGYVHAANPFKDTALAGTSSGMPITAFFDVLIGEDGERAPPIIWFERLVAKSISSYINSTC